MNIRLFLAGAVANVERLSQMFGQYSAEAVQQKLRKNDEWGTRNSRRAAA